MKVLCMVALVLGGLVSSARAESCNAVVTKVSDDQFTVINRQTNKQMTFSLSKEAKVSQQGEQTKLKSIKKGYELTITYNKEGESYIASKVEINAIEGTIVSLSETELTIKNSKTGKEMTFSLAKNAKLTLNGKNTQAKNIRKDDQALVHYQRPSDSYVATWVDIKRAE